MSLQSTPIVILGMQRSGTSALSGALSRLGLFFGKPELLYPADGNNRQGYFEHRKATLLNLKILEEFQMHVTSFNGLPENWNEFPQASELRQLLKGFLKDDFDGQRVWGIKQPLTSLVLPLYNEVFSELGLTPHYVVCVRNPLESMESESKLEFDGSYRVMQSLGTMAVGSWLRYTLGSICDAAPFPVSVVAYDELLANPRTVLESIVAAHPDWNPTEDEWKDSASSIRSDLKHNRRPSSELDEWPSIVRQTYEVALDSSQEAGQRLQELYAQFKMWVQMLGTPPPTPGKLGLAWTQGGAQRISEASFLVQNSWQTVGLEIDAEPKTSLFGFIYGVPARVWIRRCVWHASEGITDAVLKCGPASSIGNVNGIVRLDAAFERGQIRLMTPDAPGPYRLEIEFLLESSPSIHLVTAARVARQLETCVSAVERSMNRPF